MAHRAPHDLAQHVAAALVAGQDAVGDEERHRAQVVGDDAHRDVVPLVAAVGLAGALRDRVEERREEVGVVVRELALDDGRHALEAHAGVDARRGQGIERPRRVAVVLHEDEVPDLEPAVALALDAEAGLAGGLLGAGDVVALEVVDLGAGAARAGVAHRPEVVLHAELEDPVGGNVGEPEAVGLGVAGDAALALEDRDLQAVLREAEVAGEELPAERDRVLLEVVAEGEVAEHLEERVVARGDAHVLEVVVLPPGADALLRRGGARVVALLAPEEHVLELVHPGVREQQRRVVLRHERRALHHPVPALLEVAQEVAPDVVGRLQSCLPRRLRHAARPGPSFNPARPRDPRGASRRDRVPRARPTSAATAPRGGPARARAGTRAAPGTPTAAAGGAPARRAACCFQ